MRDETAMTYDKSQRVSSSGKKQGRSKERKETMPKLDNRPSRGADAEIYAKIDELELRRFPNQVLAIFRDGSGFLRDTKGEPLHAKSRRELATIVARIHPQAIWRHMFGPVDLSCSM